MPYFTYDQEQEVKKLIQGKLEEATEWGEDRDIKKYRELIEAFEKSHYEETIKEDLYAVLENMEDNEGNALELTSEQEARLINRIYKYDHSDYNEYIDHLITEELGI